MNVNGRNGLVIPLIISVCVALIGVSAAALLAGQQAAFDHRWNALESRLNVNERNVQKLERESAATVMGLQTVVNDIRELKMELKDVLLEFRKYMLER